MPADGATGLQTLGRLQPRHPVHRHLIGEELFLLFASYHAAESRCKRIEQHAGDNHKSPSLCDEAYPTREERTASNRSESSLEGNLAKTDYHKKERGTDDRTGDLV